MTDEQWNQKQRRDKKLASDALKSSGYIKTTWGYILQSRLTHCVNEGLIRTKPMLGYTKKAFNLQTQDGKPGTQAINAYLAGHKDNF